jgi:hypothetical protein
MTGRPRGETSVRQKPKAKLDAELDKALAQTFPASDPFSVGQFTGTEPPSRPVDHKPPVLKDAPRRRRKKT